MEIRFRRLVSGAVLPGLLAVGGAFAYYPPSNPDAYEPVRIVGTALSDNGDDDGWADTRETVRMRLRVWNRTDQELSGLVARLSTSDPAIACVIEPIESSLLVHTAGHLQPHVPSRMRPCHATCQVAFAGLRTPTGCSRFDNVAFV